MEHLRELLVARSGSTWHGEKLPDCCYDASAASHAESKADDPAYGVDPILSPAYKYAFWTNVLLWSFWAVYPIICFAFAQCDDKGGIAKVSSILLAAYLPVLGVALLLEFKCHKYILPPTACWVGGYRNSLLGNVPFMPYLVAIMGMSAVAHADLATGAFFTARLLKTATCPGNAMESIWEQVVKHSASPYLPGLAALGLIAWALMVCQLLLCLGQSLPYNPNNGDFKQLMGENGWLQLESAGGMSYFIPTYLQGRVYATSALHALGTSGRMSAFLFRYQALFDVSYGDKAPCHGIRDLIVSRDAMVAEMNLCAANAATFLVLETSIQTNLKTSVLFVNRIAEDEDRLDFATLLSMVLGILVAMAKLVQTYGILAGFYKSIAPYVNPKDLQNINDEYYGRTRCDTVETVSLRRYRMRRALASFGVTALVTVFLLVYAILKLFNGAFVCDSTSMWNMSGCVEISKD